MMNSTLIIRTSKTARLLFKSNTYQLKIGGEDNFEMSHLNPIKTYELLAGTHSIEIESENSSETKEITLKEGETKTLTINPVAGSNSKKHLSRAQFILIIFGLSIGSLIGMYLYFESVPIPSVFLVLLPPVFLLFFKNKINEELEDFHITVKDKAILK